MEKNMMNKAIEEMIERFTQAQKAMAGDQTVGTADDGFNTIKGAFFHVLDEAGRLTGLTNLKHRIARVYEAGGNKKSMRLMTMECIRIIDEQVTCLEHCFAFGEAAMLKELLKNGSIFEIFGKTVAWIAGHVYRIIRYGLHLACERWQVVDALMTSISGVAHLVLCGVKFAFKATKLGVSIIGAGAIKIADYVLKAVNWLLTKLRIKTSFTLPIYISTPRQKKEENPFSDFNRKLDQEKAFRKMYEEWFSEEFPDVEEQYAQMTDAMCIECPFKDSCPKDDTAPCGC